MSLEPLLTPWILFIASLAALVFTQRWLHRHMIGLGLLATGKPSAAVILYHTIMFPGVLLHEVSHWLVAGALNVRSGRFSLWPERDEAGVRLGYIEVEKPDAVRGTLIGIAPLVTGLLIVLALADKALNLPDLAAALTTGDLAVIGPAAARLIGAPDFWIWLYLIFAIANAMMPSPEDRRSWPVLIAGVLGIALLLVISGFEAAVTTALGGPVADALRLLATAFVPIIALNLFAVALIWTVERVVALVFGRSVDYGPAPSQPAQSSVSLYDRPLPVPRPPRNAPSIEPDEPHMPAPVLDE
jgi:hypothetical protein